MSDFDVEWLRLREPLDAAARSTQLALRFGAALGHEPGNSCRIIDLAAGTGSNFRALAPVIGGDQQWLLVDHDPLLIAAQSAEIVRWAAHMGWRCSDSDGGTLVETGAGRWRVHSRSLDLARSLEQLDFTACDGVTTAAFLDLVSAAWIDRLCDKLAAARRPFLAVLTVDGRREWQPPLPEDAWILEAFQKHQAGDKGFGPALGSLAAEYVRDRLAGRGYKLDTAHSDWRIDEGRPELLMRMIKEAGSVAGEVQKNDSAGTAAWLSARREYFRTGGQILNVGHTDLLGVCRPQVSGGRR